MDGVMESGGGWGNGRGVGGMRDGDVEEVGRGVVVVWGVVVRVVEGWGGVGRVSGVFGCVEVRVECGCVRGRVVVVE